MKIILNYTLQCIFIFVNNVIVHIRPFLDGILRKLSVKDIINTKPIVGFLLMF